MGGQWAKEWHCDYGATQRVVTGSVVTPLKSGQGGGVSPPYWEERGLPFSTGLKFCGEHRRVATRMLALALGAQQVKEEEHGQPHKGARIDSNINSLLSISLSTRGALKNTRQFLYIFPISGLTLGWGSDFLLEQEKRALACFARSLSSRNCYNFQCASTHKSNVSCYSCSVPQVTNFHKVITCLMLSGLVPGPQLRLLSHNARLGILK